MITKGTNPPHVTVTFPNREPYVFWDHLSMVIFINMLLTAARVFDKPYVPKPPEELLRG